MKNYKYFLIACVCMMLSISAFAADYKVGDEIPFVEGQPAPQPAPQYAWCLEKRKAVLQTIKEKVLVREGSWYYESVQPIYQSKMERVMVEPEQKKSCSCFSSAIPYCYRRKSCSSCNS